MPRVKSKGGPEPDVQSVAQPEPAQAGTSGTSEGRAVVPDRVQAKASALAHARASRRLQPAREGRVRQCMDLIRALKWEPGVTIRDLAESWGISGAHAREVSGEAMRRVRAENEAEAPAHALFGVKRLREIASKPGVGDRDAVHAIDVLLKFCASSDTTLPPGWAQMGVDERWAAIDRAQAKLDAALATVPPRADANDDDDEGKGTP